MVCRIQNVGERCLKLVIIKLCHRILQGISKLHVGGGEGTEHSQILIYFYPLQFSKIQFIWGSRQLAVIEQPTSLATSASKGIEFLEPRHCDFPKGFSSTFFLGM